MSGSLVANVILGIIVALIAFVVIAQYKSIAHFAMACRVEMKKVAWPTRERVFLQTRVVLISLVITSLFFGGIDLVLTAFMSFIFD